MADQSYLDRLYDEIGQYGDRLARTVRGPDGFSEVAKNWTTPYETPERRQESMRLAAQQAKEEYMAQQNAGQLSLKDAIESQRIREDIGKRLQALGPDTSYLAEQERLRMQAAKEGYMAQQYTAQTPAQDYQQPSIPGLDPYAQYLQENAAALMGPYLPHDQYAAPTREDYQKYYVEGQAPPKVVAVPPAVAEMAASMPRQAQPGAMPAPAGMPQEMAAQQQFGQQRPMTIRDQIAALPYEADRLDATRKVIQQTRLKTYNDAVRHVSETYGIETPQGQNALKIIKDSIDENLPLPKPIDETPQYKEAQKNWTDLRKVGERISLVNGAVAKSKELMAVDEQAALRHMKTNLIKPLNSILSNDAIQLSEMLIRYSDLLNASETAALAGKSAFNPTIWFNKYSTAESSGEKKQMLEDLVDRVAKANPKRFLETAINGVNGYIDSYNGQLQQQVVNPTSPAIAKQMGAVMFEPIQHMQQTEALPSSYPQAQTAAPAQRQVAPAADIEAIRNRLKTGYKQQ